MAAAVTAAVRGPRERRLDLMAAAGALVLGSGLAAWGADDSYFDGEVSAGGWLRAVVAVAYLLAVAGAVMAVASVHDDLVRTVLATVAILIGMTFQAAAVFAPILSGACSSSSSARCSSRPASSPTGATPAPTPPRARRRPRGPWRVITRGGPTNSPELLGVGALVHVDDLAIEVGHRVAGAPPPRRFRVEEDHLSGALDDHAQRPTCGSVLLERASPRISTVVRAPPPEIAVGEVEQRRPVVAVPVPSRHPRRVVEGGRQVRARRCGQDRVGELVAHVDEPEDADPAELPRHGLHEQDGEARKPATELDRSQSSTRSGRCGARLLRAGRTGTPPVDIRRRRVLRMSISPRRAGAGGRPCVASFLAIGAIARRSSLDLGGAREEERVCSAGGGRTAYRLIRSAPRASALRRRVSTSTRRRKAATAARSSSRVKRSANRLPLGGPPVPAPSPRPTTAVAGTAGYAVRSVLQARQGGGDRQLGRGCRGPARTTSSRRSSRWGGGRARPRPAPRGRPGPLVVVGEGAGEVGTQGRGPGPALCRVRGQLGASGTRPVRRPSAAGNQMSKRSS